MIPEHCIEYFKNTFNVYPCISEISVPTKELLRGILKNSSTIWYLSDENDEKQLIKEEYLQYDKTGIYIYYKLIEDGVFAVHFLFEISKRDNIEFDLHILKKQIKNYGNYSGRTEKED